ncbi:MAG: hypothetical protein K2X27_18425 [Candidatus Obscuribacterales bacterium]|nr:hypothetical protein [Candidatus Obscuribacterales bacterium]
MTEAESQKPSEIEAEKSNIAEPSPKANSEKPRKGLLAVAQETMLYIEKAEKDKSITFRTNDRISVILIMLSFTLEAGLLLLFMSNPAMRNVCIGMALIADFLFGLAILWFVLLRFGVLRTVEARHALLCWQLMIGAGALFAFYTTNIAFLFFTLYNVNSNQLPPSL